MTNKITLETIRAPSSKRGGRIIPGRVEEGAKAEIVPGISIRIFGTKYTGTSHACSFDKTFKVGDLAEYDSFNLSYVGRILSIGAKTVTIESEFSGSRKKTHRLTIHTFTWRNWDFDLEEISKRNAETMQSI